MWLIINFMIFSFQYRQFKFDKQRKIINMWKYEMTFTMIIMNLKFNHNTIWKIWNYYEVIRHIVSSLQIIHSSIISKYDHKYFKRYIKSTKEYRCEILINIIFTLNFNISRDILCNEFKKFNFNHHITRKKSWLHSI